MGANRQFLSFVNSEVLVLVLILYRFFFFESYIV